MARGPRPLGELLVVAFDETNVRVRALEEAHRSWNQECRWADVARVCFRDAGPWQSDTIYLELHDRPQPLEIPIEARGGAELLGELHARGLFPQPVFGQAIRSTDGGLYCWPA